MFVIRTQDFCEEVAVKAGLSFEMISEVVGGIANLYLEEAFRSGGIFETETIGFASSAIPKDILLVEIRNCSGVSIETAEYILSTMQETLKDLMVRNNLVQVGSRIVIEALGEFETRDITGLLFRLKYSDPAHSSYNQFLLS